ncbi:MAG: Coenzyme F420 hydrogenase/dehydrogenase, beta subunit C-terminal domain [Hyphomicrobium sp.]|nr:Coenzyme F420 hydrogenase/dehydrogenase, beta subunit C-terminal domain [Hyphomicrobium sp.]
MEEHSSSSTSGAFERVVGGGYCIGCGACALPSMGDVRIELDGRGMFQAVAGAGHRVPEPFEAICPFSGASADEDEIGRTRFAAEGGAWRGEIGHFRTCYAGHVERSDFRDVGSSGGLVTWVLCALFENGMIDGALHVAPAGDRPLFGYRLSTSLDEIRAGAKSRYYPVEMSAALAQVLDRPGRYAVVGTPCFIKAIELLARSVPEIAERVAYRIAIVCGHLKSARFADYLALRASVAPRDVGTIDFRHKVPERLASDYSAQITTRSGDENIVRMSEVYGGNWGYGFFRYPACDYCDDVVGETADISIGDAWLPGYIRDWKGTNIIVVRTREVEALIEAGIAAGELKMDAVSDADVVQSQLGGLRDRREGLAYRLALKDRQGLWRPRKRVAPSMRLPAQRRRIYDLRLRISQASHEFSAEPGAGFLALTGFEARLRPLTDAYDALYRPPAWRRAVNGVRRALSVLKRRLFS